MKRVGAGGSVMSMTHPHPSNMYVPPQRDAEPGHHSSQPATNHSCEIGTHQTTQLPSTGQQTITDGNIEKSGTVLLWPTGLGAGGGNSKNH